jgi:hypothetical protein
VLGEAESPGNRASFAEATEVDKNRGNRLLECRHHSDSGDAAERAYDSHLEGLERRA